MHTIYISLVCTIITHSSGIKIVYIVNTIMHSYKWSPRADHEDKQFSLKNFVSVFLFMKFSTVNNILLCYHSRVKESRRKWFWREGVLIFSISLSQRSRFNEPFRYLEHVRKVHRKVSGGLEKNVSAQKMGGCQKMKLKIRSEYSDKISCFELLKLCFFECL